jgi:DNA ligase (NAD+)
MIDGLVIEFVNKQIRSLGYLDNRPRFAIALKFPYMEKTSEVTGIEWEVSPNGTGRITPMVKFKPVEFNGAVQSRISLANYIRYQKLQPIGIGTKCLIEYRNDVLSYFTKLDCTENNKIKPIPFTTTCPCCGGKVEINKNKTFAYCSNETCPSKTVGRINNYINKLDIKGIELKTIEKLFNAGLVTKISDIYNVDVNKMSELEGFGRTSALNFKDAVDNNMPYDYEILAGMGIEGIAKKNSKELMKEFRLADLTDFNIIKSEDFKQAVKNIEGFADISASNLVNGLVLYNEDLKELVVSVRYRNSDQRKPNEKQLKFVITGDTEYFKDRNDFINAVEGKGHRVIGSVSKNTDYLVNNNPDSTSVKNQKAKTLNIPIITDTQAAQLLGIKKSK